MTIQVTTPSPHLAAAIEAAPSGTSGLVIAPWSREEVYGVAAQWSQAAAPVYAYGETGWQPTGRQVADYGHRPKRALIALLTAELRFSGDDEEVAEAAIAIATDATAF